MTDKPEQFGIKDSERTRCEIWTRVMGYHRPISSFNIGKQGEVAERKYFSEKKCHSEFQVRYKEKQIWYTEREKAFIANPDLQKEWAKIWSEFNKKYVEKVEGWENILYNKEKTLSRGEFLKWKSKNINEYIDSKGNIKSTPNEYGEY